MMTHSVPSLSSPSVQGQEMLWPGFRVKVQQRDDFNEIGYSFTYIPLESVHTPCWKGTVEEVLPITLLTSEMEPDPAQSLGFSTETVQELLRDYCWYLCSRRERLESAQSCQAETNGRTTLDDPRSWHLVSFIKPCWV